MSTKSTTPPSEPTRKCWSCGESYTKKEAVQIDVNGRIAFACPYCGATRMAKTLE